MVIQDDIDALTSAIAGTELRVRFADGREVYYRSIAELIAARSILRAETESPTVLPGTAYSSFVRD
jgi:hypothetical protein